MTPGSAYCGGTLVRVIGTTHGDGRGKSFAAGLVIDPATQRVVIAAPILGYLRGQHADQIRQTFKRLGWKATIVKRKGASAP